MPHAAAVADAVTAVTAAVAAVATSDFKSSLV